MASWALKSAEVPNKCRCPLLFKRKQREKEREGERTNETQGHRVGSSASKSPVAAAHTGPHCRWVVWRSMRSSPVATLTPARNRAPLQVDRLLFGGKGPVTTQTSDH